MPSQSDISHQQQRLVRYRDMLVHYLDQRAQLGMASEPPGIANGIREARSEIAHSKAILRRWGIAVEDLPDDTDVREPLPDPADLAVLPFGSLSQRPASFWLGAALVLLILVGGVGLILARAQIFIGGSGNVTNTGSGSITINQGDSPEVRQQKLDQAKQLLIDDVLSNLQALDARLRVADTALRPLADPLATARQTVAPMEGTPAASTSQNLAARPAESIRSKWANQTIRTVVDPPLIQVLIASGVESSGVRTFYKQMAEAQDAGEALLTTFDSAARNAPDQRSRDYWAQRIACDHDILRNSARGAYVVGLQVLGQLGAPPDLVTSSLGQLAAFTPHPPLSDTQINDLRAEVDAETNALNQRRSELLEKGSAMIDQEVATYTALNAQLAITDADAAEVVGVKASKLRRLGRAQDAIAGFQRYGVLMANDPTTAQYIETALSLTQQHDLCLRSGVYIFAVKAESAAARAGIQAGDIIVSYDGSSIALPDDLRTATELTPAGKTVVVEWLRLDASGRWSAQQTTLQAGALGAGLMAI